MKAFNFDSVKALMIIVALCTSVAFFSSCHKERSASGAEPVESGVRDGLKSMVLETGSGYEVIVPSIIYPPFLDPDVEGGGISFDLLRLMLEGSPYSLVPRFLPPARCELEILTRNYPVTLYNLSLLDRDPDFERVTNTLVYYSFFHRKGAEPVGWLKLDDLQGQRLAVLRMQERSPYRMTLINAGLVISEVDSLEQAFLLLINDKVDLVLAIEQTAVHLFKELFPEGHEIVAYEKKLRLIPGGPWFNLKHPHGLEMYRAALAGRDRLMKNGELLRIHETLVGYSDRNFLDLLKEIETTKEQQK